MPTANWFVSRRKISLFTAGGGVFYFWEKGEGGQITNYRKGHYADGKKEL